VDFFDEIQKGLASKRVGIEEFCESTDFCGKRLYPRQKLLLKLMFLEELTGKEEDILNYWIKGGRSGKEILISPLIRERVQTLRDMGYSHFREIVLVGGRRSSKGFVTGMALAKKMYDTLQLQDPGTYYGIDPDKEIYFTCLASSQDQAKKYQYADFSSTIARCRNMEDSITKIQELEFSVATEADKQMMGRHKRAAGRMGRDISKLRGQALAANASTLRGSATIAICFDEMAHMQQEGESAQTASSVYEAAMPSLAQFGKDAMVFCNPPEAPMWMADLSFKPIGDVQVGDRVIGWHKPEGKVHRELCDSEVLNVIRRESAMVKITMESGRVFRCTPDHRWLTLSSGGNKETHGGEWYAPPKVGRKLAHVVDPTPELSHDLIRDAAWLGGMFDGEGYAARAKQLTICQSRSVNPLVCGRIEKTLDRLGFQWVYHPINGKLGEGGAYHILGGKQTLIDFANWTRPAQLHKLQDKALTGRWRTEDKIASIEDGGYGEVVALTTTTGNYICNGYASKNCNSSPYTKIGKFYERYEDGLRVKDGKPLAPLMFTFQFPSWALFEGWQDDPERRFRKAITVSPDWDPEEKVPETDKYYHSPEDRDAIIIARDEERQDPDTYKVERRAEFAEIVDAFLRPEMVDRAYLGRPTRDGGFIGLKNNFNNSSFMYKYKAHLDPSSTTAGFGFAMGHVEQLEEDDGRLRDHVVIDIVQRWTPDRFPEGVVDWQVVLKDIVRYINLFEPYEITFDQFQSQAPIQWLNKWLRENNMSNIMVYEKTATAQYNWNRAEVFRTALYQGLVHIPNDTRDAEYSAQELKHLQQVNTAGRFPRVDKQEIGPVQTKDMADCIMEVTEALIGNVIANETRTNLGELSPQVGAQGGYQIGGRNEQMDNFYHSRKGTNTFREQKSSAAEATNQFDKVRNNLDRLTASRSGSWNARGRRGGGGGRGRGY
jgi:hypothetical protein